MIRRVIDRVHAIVSANFNTDFATLAAAAAVPAITADFFKRQAAERFSLRTSAGIGIYHDGGGTSRRRPGAASGSGIRDTRVEVVLDWYIRGSDEEDLGVQTELAIQAILQSIDRLPTALVWSAGDRRESVSWTVHRTPLSDDSRIPEERAIVRVPMMVREEDL